MAELFRPGTPRLRPVARPVDTFVRPYRGAAPQRPSGSNALLGLADALTQVEPRLNRFLDQQSEELKTKEEAEGAAAFAEGKVDGIEANRLAWKELIDRERENDKVQNTANADRLTAMSPHFKRGYMKAQLDSMGMVFEDHLLSQWNSNPEIELPDGSTVQLHQTDDPVALSTWMHQITRDFMSEHGLDKMDDVMLAESFLPRVRGAQQGMASRHNEFRLQEQRNEYGWAFGSNLQMVMGGIVATGQTEEGLVALQSRLDEAVKDGLPPRVANEILVSSVITAAKEAGDPSILNIIQGINTGNGSLGNVEWVKESLQAARDAIDNKQKADERHRVWQEDQARERALRATMNKAARAMLSNPAADISQWTDELIRAGNWSQALQLQATQDQMLDRQNAVRPNHTEIASIRRRISLATTDAERREIMGDIMAGVGTHYSADWAVRMMDDLDNAERYADVFNDNHVAGWESDLERRIDARFVDPVTKEVYDDTRGKEAALLFRDSLTDWIEQEGADGVPPSKSEIRAKADELGSAILRNERFSFDERNPPKGNGTLRTPAEQEVLGTRPEFNTIQTIMDAPQGAVQFSPQTLPETDVQLLVNDHLQRGENSTLAQIAANQGMEAGQVAQALMGLDSDPFAPRNEAAAAPSDTAAGTTPTPQNEGPQPLQIEADPEVMTEIADLLDASFLERGIGGVNLGSTETPFVQALQDAGIVKTLTSRRNGTTYSVDYDAALEVLSPTIRQWGEAAGLDTRLLEPGSISVQPGDPILELVDGEAFNRRDRAYTISQEDKLRAIINLISNATE